MTLQQSLWLFNDKITINTTYGRKWAYANRLYLRDNGGRKADECLCITFQVWRFEIQFTYWYIGRLARLLRFIPAGKSDRGLEVGWVK